MAYDVDRRPGAWVRAQATRRERIFWIFLAMGGIGLAVYLVLVVGHRVGVGAALFVLALGAVARRRGNRFIDENARWFNGAHAEESVGAMLNELRREGWILMHDVEQNYEGNIDHIASGPGGVFLIETKLRGYRERDLVKARRQAAKLHDEIAHWVTPVICLYQRGGEPFTADRVAIVPSQHLLGWLRKQTGKPLPFERLARYADRID